MIRMRNVGIHEVEVRRLFIESPKFMSRTTKRGGNYAYRMLSVRMKEKKGKNNISLQNLASSAVYPYLQSLRMPSSVLFSLILVTLGARCP